MTKTIIVSGMAMVTRDENSEVRNIQFLPDDELASVMEVGCRNCGQLQLLRNGAFDYVSQRPRQRANSTLLRKAAHGRLSATQDEAYQLTLKIFKREGLDVRATLMREATELIENVKF